MHCAARIYHSYSTSKSLKAKNIFGLCVADCAVIMYNKFSFALKKIKRDVARFLGTTRSQKQFSSFSKRNTKGEKLCPWELL